MHNAKDICRDFIGTYISTGQTGGPDFSWLAVEGAYDLDKSDIVLLSGRVVGWVVHYLIHKKRLLVGVQ